MTIGEFFSLLGGVGLFLFGMTIMSTGLKNSCGDNLQKILEKATANKYVAVIVGIAMTMIIQSSSATDVMVIGFVNSGLMNIAQAIGVIMGANIGTTITAQITAFSISTFTPFLLFIGAIMYLFFKKQIVKSIGSVIMGFGMLFQGVTLMKASIAPLAATPWFESFLSTLNNPALAVIFGVLFTALLQSSSSSIVIFQAFCVQGILSYNIAVYLVIGAAIGSVTPNILASLTANRNGKRTAIINLLFNLIRAVIIIVMINIFPAVLTFIQNLSPDDIGRQIANTHTIFAIFAVLVELPFTNNIIALANKIIPVQEGESRLLEERQLQYMNQIENVPPHMATRQAQLEAVRMGRIAYETLALSVDNFFEYSEENAELIREREETVDILNKAIADEMAKLRGLELTSEHLARVSHITIAITDIERVSDHAINILEYVEQLKSRKEKISKKGRKELREMADNTLQAIDIALDIFASEDFSRLPEVERIEAIVDDMETELINNHVNRLMKENCEPFAGIVFSDMVTDLERSSDHAMNIAYAMMKDEDNKKKR